MATEVRPLGRAVSAQADRPTQEDRFLVWEGLLFQAPAQIYAVFDGHNGTIAAEICQRYLATDFFRAYAASRSADNDFRPALFSAVNILESRILSATAASHTHDGSTICALLIHNQILYTCNVGDSRAVLVRDDASDTQLTVDHKVRHSAERQRLINAGATLKRNRLLGPYKDLELSRALGDREFKSRRATLIATPDVTQRALNAHDEMILLATDGLWDIGFLDNEELARMGLQELRRTQDVALTASYLLEQALNFRTSDNVTLIVIMLRKNSRSSGSHASSSNASSASASVPHRVQTRSGAPDDLPYAMCQYWEAARLSSERRHHHPVVHTVSTFVRRRKKSGREKR